MRRQLRLLPQWSSICNRTRADTQLVLGAAVPAKRGLKHTAAVHRVPNPVPLTLHVGLGHRTLEAVSNSHRLSSAKGWRQFLLYNAIRTNWINSITFVFL